MTQPRTPYLQKLRTLNISRRGFIRVATAAGVGVASGPFLVRRARGQGSKPRGEGRTRGSRRATACGG